MTAQERIRPVPGEPPAWRFPAVERFTLDNGIRVFACHLAGRPVLDMRVITEGGVGREGRDIAGLAYVTAEAVVEGTELRRGPAFHEALELLGGHIKTDASWSGITIDVTVPVGHAPSALQLLSELVTSPALHDDDVARAVKKRVDQAAFEAMLPQITLGHEAQAAMYADTARRGLPTNGTVDTVGALTGQSVRDWWARHVFPASTTILVTGDLGGIDLASAVDKAFGGWTAAGDPLPPLAAEEPAPTGRTILIDQPGAVQATCMLGQAVAAIPDGDKPAVDVAMTVLCGYFSSRLMKRLREDRTIAYTVGGGVQTFTSGSLLQISAPVDQAATGEAVSIILEEVSTLADTLTDEEARRAADYLKRRAAIGYNSVGAVAARLANRAMTEKADDEFDAYIEGLERVTALSAADAFRRHFDVERMALCAAGSASQVYEPLEALRPGVELKSPLAAAGALAGVLGAAGLAGPGGLAGKPPAGARTISDPKQAAAPLAAAGTPVPTPDTPPGQ
jgi:predicted Zn-dependent peptidase